MVNHLMASFQYYHINMRFEKTSFTRNRFSLHLSIFYFESSAVVVVFFCLKSLIRTLLRTENYLALKQIVIYSPKFNGFCSVIWLYIFFLLLLLSFTLLRFVLYSRHFSSIYLCFYLLLSFTIKHCVLVFDTNL